MKRLLLGLALVALTAAACGGDNGATTVKATKVEITARDYSFTVPDSFKGGLVEFRYTNAGQEPHFASLIKTAAGKTEADVKQFFSGPPAGPPPFEEIAALATAQPGATGNMTLNIEPGQYAFFCAISSPDGIPHVAKGMFKPVTVTEGETGTLPAAVGTIIARNFSYDGVPTLRAGENVVALKNEGTQIHEINLVEFQPGKTIGDVIAWLANPAGPPPAQFLSGAAIRPGGTATTTLSLRAGSTYAFLCAIPDPSDGKSHYTKGMVSQTLTVS